jgi:hypothetical protein
MTMPPFNWIVLGVAITLCQGARIAQAATNPGNGVAASPIAIAKEAMPTLFQRFPAKASARPCLVDAGTLPQGVRGVVGRCETHLRYLDKIGNPAVVTFVERWRSPNASIYSHSWTIAVSAKGRVTKIQELHSSSSNGMAPPPSG